MSTEPYLEITTQGRIVSLHFQFAPYHLRNGDWGQERAVLERCAIEMAGGVFPQLKSSIRDVTSLTPLDLEKTYGLTEGDLNHGQLMLDQDRKSVVQGNGGRNGGGWDENGHREEHV